MYAAYTLLAGVALVLVYAPAALLRRLRRGVPLHLRDRLALRASRPAPGPRAGWLHAVSVGEAIAAAPLVEGLHRLRPDLPLVVTTVTATGAGVVGERYAGVATHRFFPIDLPWAVRRFLDALHPAFLVCMETELWPNLLRALAARRIPVMIANGRISDRSYRRYRLIRPFMARVLDGVRVFAMQSAEDARRIIALGAHPERVVVTGNVKNEPLPDTAGSVDLWRRMLGLEPGQPVWIAGSTHRGEEAMVLDAHQRARREFPNLGLVLAPRHPERADEVADLVAARGFPVVRRSALPRARERHAIVVLDTVGELAPLYSVADVVFVGGSLVPAGGHNMLEAALRRKPVLFGPHATNFREAATLLETVGAALVVRDGDELGRELARLLADADLRQKLGEAGYEAVASRHGAVQETLDLAARFLLPGAAG
jgi:3-deoxy-D-manno-octulosonic-acid transferase